MNWVNDLRPWNTKDKYSSVFNIKKNYMIDMLLLRVTCAILAVGSSRFDCSNALVLARILPAHHPLVSRALAALPEASTLPANDSPPAEITHFHRVVLLSTAPTANHSVRPLVHMVLCFVVASVAGMDLTTT